MTTLKVIQTSFTASKPISFNAARLSNNKKISTLCLCKSVDSNSEESSPEGDKRKQELLARIAQLQAQKVRLTDYLDEKSSSLSQFAEEAEAELDRIGEDALKELDEAGDRVSVMFLFEHATYNDELHFPCKIHDNPFVIHLWLADNGEY